MPLTHLFAQWVSACLTAAAAGDVDGTTAHERMMVACSSHAEMMPAAAVTLAGDDAELCRLAVGGDTALDGRACSRAARRARAVDAREWFAAAAADCDCLDQRAEPDLAARVCH